MTAEIRLLGADDAPWIGRVLDVVERCIGQPWRVMLERLEHAPTGAAAAKVDNVVGALRRVIGGRAERGRVARKLRGMVLGAPALDAAARCARLASAAAELGIDAGDVELLLWADLAKERPVTLPRGRPDERELAAFANVDRIRHAVMRAKEIRLRVWDDDAHALVRTIARYGLASVISRAADGATILEVTGPLSLFHATTIYGRAFAALVPLLANHAKFTLEIRCDLGEGERRLYVTPPVLLPPVQPPRRRGPTPAERLARDLEEAGYLVDRTPAPIPSDGTLLFPELSFDREGVRWYVEIIGFSTDEYLARKLDRYRSAGITTIVLALDATRTRSAPPPSATGCVLLFERRIEVDALLAALGAAP